MADDEIVSICSDGDVILVIRDDQQQQQGVKLRVDNYRLQASKVFKAMFGPNFKEGQHLDKQRPPEISLADDPKSLEIICQVLHFRNNSLPNILDAEKVLKLAQTVEKYELQEAMKLAMKEWLIDTSCDSKTLFMLLEAAILTESKSGFEAITCELIMNHVGPFTDTYTFTFNREHVLTTLLNLELKRTSLRQELNQMLFNEARSVSAGCGCHKVNSLSSGILQKMSTGGISPQDIGQLSIAQACYKIEAMEDPATPRDCSERCRFAGSHRGPGQVGASLKRAIETLKDFKGLELKEIIRGCDQ